MAILDNYDNMNDPMDDYLYVEETLYMDPGYEPNPDTNVIKEAVGEAISDIPGVLALKSGLTDIFKKDSDLTRGISARKLDNGEVDISVKVIAEAGYNEDELVQQMTEAIEEELQARMHLVARKLDVEIAEFMFIDDFFEKYDPDRALH